MSYLFANIFRKSCNGRIEIMIQNLRSIFLIIILIASAFVLPALMGASLIDMPEEDDFAEEEGDDFSLINHFSPDWIRIPVHQLSVLLRLGISIFALFVVYLGGRSKHRRFNDRTIDHINALTAAFLKTALCRAVFIFLFPAAVPHRSTKLFVNHLLPILIPNSRRSL